MTSQTDFSTAGVSRRRALSAGLAAAGLTLDDALVRSGSFGVDGGQEAAATRYWPEGAGSGAAPRISSTRVPSGGIRSGLAMNMSWDAESLLSKGRSSMAVAKFDTQANSPPSAQ